VTQTDPCAHNKEISRAVFDVWSTGELGRLDNLVAAEVVHHDPHDPNGAEGLAGLKRTIKLNRATFDMRLFVEDQVAEGSKMVTRWRAEMTHSGRLGGVQPTGRKVSVTGITIERFEHGRIVEAWRSMDTLGVLRGIGAV
jgi:predicted ester cyclase